MSKTVLYKLEMFVEAHKGTLGFLNRVSVDIVSTLEGRP